jgi:hypothetical protein
MGVFLRGEGGGRRRLKTGLDYDNNISLSFYKILPSTLIRSNYCLQRNEEGRGGGELVMV